MLPRRVQIRRYELDPAQVDDFLQWWSAVMRPLRLRMGFDVVFAAADRERSEFTWATTAADASTEFDAIASRYEKSAQRHEALASMPPAIRNAHITMCELVWPEPAAPPTPAV
jgi:hypothetical protein